MTEMKDRVEKSLQEKLSPVHLVVEDTSAGHCGSSFDVQIVSGSFDGLGLVQRHRLVHSAISEEMKDIHALSIKSALTPQQWEDRK